MFEKLDLALTQANQLPGLLILKTMKAGSSDSECDSYKDDSDKSNSRIFESYSPSENTSNQSERCCSDEDEPDPLTLNHDGVLALIFKGGVESRYVYSKTLAKGSYGEVFVLNRTKDSEQGPEQICLKVGIRTGDVDGDVFALERLNSSTCQDTLIESLVLKQKYIDKMGVPKSEPIILMERMDDNLKRFFQFQKFKSISEKYGMVCFVLSRISLCFFHLVNKKLYYTDVKISNCLYKREKSRFRVVLGDIGSAFPNNCHEAIATYPHMYHQKCHDFKPDIYDLIYGLLILFLEMMSISHVDQSDQLSISRDLFDQLYFKQVKPLNLKERIKILEMLFEELESLHGNNKTLTKLMSEIRRKTVLSLKEIKEIKDSEKDHLNQLHKLYIFFKQSYEHIGWKGPPSP